MLKAFEIFLLFVTLWVIVICGFVYLSRRHGATWAARRHQPGNVSSQCCLEVPCSKQCARVHQEQQDLVKIRYGEVVRELGHIIGADPSAPRELEAADAADMPH
jgi:hypothetical protein